MVKVVLEASRHHRFIGLLGQHDGVFIVTIKVNLFNLLVLVCGLELISIKDRRDI